MHRTLWRVMPLHFVAPPGGVTRRHRVAATALGTVMLALLSSACSTPSARATTTDAGDGRVRVSVERPVMKTLFRIDAIVTDEAVALAAIEAALAEVERAEEILSNWSRSSQITEVNRLAGVRPVTVSDELITVLDRALYFSRVTGGAFDITFASCDGLWSIRDRRVPSDADIAACLEHVDYRRVALDPQRSAVFIADPGMRLGIAGLAKGYRIDRAAAVLERAGIRSYVVDGGGDMRIATDAGRRPWTIDIAHPRRADRPLASLELASGAVATSGDYEWFFERDGVRYHHIIDPSTGRPASRCISATVIAATAVDADALATGLFVMGPEAGVALAERMDDVEAMLIAPDLSHHATSGFPAIAAAVAGSS